MDNKSFEADGASNGGTKSPEPLPAPTVVDIDSQESKPADKPYAGMGKEDLLRFSQTPFWNTVRLVSLIIFWAAWIGLLVAVVVLTVVAPRCDPPPEQTWWQKTTIYQIYTRSFYDTNGDGIGDIKGITAKLDYIQSLNAETLMVSAFYPSHYGTGQPSNMGYDVTNHTAVDPDYGTMDDFEELLEKAHEKDMKVVIDFIPNHTGDLHPWFAASSNGGPDPSNPFWNYYVWEDCTPPTIYPNNWASVYDGPAWVENVARTQCFLNQFLTDDNGIGGVPSAGYQPELNLRSTAVREELEAILRFWLDMGVDGFRVVDAKYLYEDADLRDEAEICTPAVGDYSCLDHSRTTDQPEVYEIVTAWRLILEEYSSTQERILITDANSDVNTTVGYYGLGGTTGSHLPLNYQLLSLEQGTTTGNAVKDLVDAYLTAKPEAATADWMTSTPDLPRMSGTATEGFARSIGILKMTLPGAAVIYYGEELGMVDGSVGTPSDPSGLGRDNYRTLMQWDDSPNGGFSNGTNSTGSAPWVPVNDDYEDKNVELYETDGNSILNIYKTLGDMHLNEDGLAIGAVEYGTVNDDIFSFVRQFDGTNRILVAISFGAGGTFDLRQGDADIPGSAELLIATSDAGVSGAKVGEGVNLSEVQLASGEGAVFMWPFSR